MYKDGRVPELSEFGKLAKTGILNFSNYDRYDDAHNQFKILEKRDGKWMLTETVKRHLEL